MTDEMIIDMYFSRNEDAISFTKEKYNKYLYTIAYNILRIMQDSEECVNETYLGAWNTIPPKRPSVLKTYLAKLARNISLKRFRHNTAQKRGGTQVDLALEELSEFMSGSDSVESTIEREELLTFIKEFVKKLNDEQRQIFLARYWYLYSVKDIARKLGYGESKVKMTLKRTKDKLFDELRKEELL